MKLNVTMIRRMALSVVMTMTMTCAVAACSGTDEGEGTDGNDVPAAGEEGEPAQDSQQTVELGTAEQAVCKCQGYEGYVQCSTTHNIYEYFMCSATSLNSALAACRRACSGGSCVIHPANC